jgi:amidohydrolase
MIDPHIISLRQRLHAHPEVSNEEYKTAEIIKGYLTRYNPSDIIEGLGGSGVAAVYSYPNPGKTIVIRCELDALPIQEQNDISYRSTYDGVSHKCGHDGHMAIVSSLAAWLDSGPINNGKVVLLYQPAEENGQGADRVLQDERFRALQPDHIFALHNLPKEPMHQILLMTKGFSAEVQSLIIRLTGKESHAAEPEHGINPTLAISKIAQELVNLGKSNPQSDSFAVLTPVHINVGQPSYGISPGAGEIHYTIRTWTKDKMKLLKYNITEIVSDISRTHQLQDNIEWLEYFPASINDADSNEIVKLAAITNGYDITEKNYPFKFGEDFGWYAAHYKTSIFGLGAGVDTPALHNADYDFPDELISTGSDMFKAIVRSILS